MLAMETMASYKFHMSQVPKKKDVVAITMTENLRQLQVPERLAKLVKETGLDRSFIAGIALRDGLPLIEADRMRLIQADPVSSDKPTPPKLREQRRIGGT